MDTFGVVADTTKSPCGVEKKANVAELPGVHIWWDWRCRDFVGEFLPEHRLRGTARRFGFCDLTGNRLGYGGGLENNTYKAKIPLFEKLSEPFTLSTSSKPTDNSCSTFKE